MEGTSNTENFEKFIVDAAPTVYYVPQYITPSEEQQLLNNIYNAPVSKWKSLKNRRLQNWGGVVHEKGLIAQDLSSWLKQVTFRISEESKLFPSAINHVLINEYLPDQGIMPHQDGPAYFPVVAILSLGSPVVMNFTPHPSLTSRDNLDHVFSRPADKDITSHNYQPFSLVLMPRSLLIFKDKAYSDYLHGIEDCKMQRYNEAVNVRHGMEVFRQEEHLPSLRNASDHGEVSSDNVIHRTTTRISLTCRVVTKVRKNLIKI